MKNFIFIAILSLISTLSYAQKPISFDDLITQANNYLKIYDSIDYYFIDSIIYKL